MKTKLKNFIKKYFSSFVFFYRYLGNRIFLAFFLSVAVSFLDGLGLTMFFPLLQVVGGEGEVDTEAMGNMRYLPEGIEQTGIIIDAGKRTGYFAGILQLERYSYLYEQRIHHHSPAKIHPEYST